MKLNPLLNICALLVVGIVEDEDVVAELDGLDVAELLGMEDEPVAVPLEEAGDVAAEAGAEGVEVESDSSVAIAAAAVDDERDVGFEAGVASAPIPVEVSTAERRDPTFSPETHVPATLLLMSYTPTSPASQQNPLPS